MAQRCGPGSVEAAPPVRAQRGTCVRELRKSNQRLERAERLARFATWEWSLETDSVRWSIELCHLLGRDATDEVGLDAVLDMVHPVDRTRVERQLVGCD